MFNPVIRGRFGIKVLHVFATFRKHIWNVLLNFDEIRQTFANKCNMLQSFVKIIRNSCCFCLHPQKRLKTTYKKKEQ